jgi:hypothetical protein
MSTYAGYQCEFVVIRNTDGSYSTFPNGKIPAGTPLRSPRRLTVSGQGEVPNPPKTASPAELIEWVKSVNNDGYFATLRNP